MVILTYTHRHNSHTTLAHVCDTFIDNNNNNNIVYV